MRVWRLPHGRYQVTVGVDTDDDERPDAQIATGEQELWRYDGALPFTARPGPLTVTVHNIGGSAAPASVLQVLGEAGEIATAQVPALEAPFDLQPKTATVRIDLPAGAQPAIVLLDSEGAIAEITEANNRVGDWN